MLNWIAAVMVFGPLRGWPPDGRHDGRGDGGSIGPSNGRDTVRQTVRWPDNDRDGVLT
jgi:hypothetical protein